MMPLNLFFKLLSSGRAKLLPGRAPLALLAALLAVTPHHGHALSFFSSTNAQVSEFAAITNANLFRLGIQSMPAAPLGNLISVGSSSVFPGVAAGAQFPSGTSTNLGITLQSNAGGTNSAAVNPGSGLMLIGPLDPGEFTRIGPDSNVDSLDILLEPPGYVGAVRAVSMAVRADDNLSPVIVKLYSAGGLIGQQTFTAGTQRIGFVINSNGLIRVNVHAPGSYVEAGEIALHTLVGPPSPVGSSIFALPLSDVRLDQGSLVTVTVADEDGRPRESGGDDVTVAVSGGSLTALVDNRDGTYTATLSRTNPGVARVTAYLGTTTNAPQIGFVDVTFIAGRAAAMSALTADETIININGGTTVIRGRITDAFGNTPAGVRVSFTSSVPQSASVTNQVFTDANGDFTAVVSGASQPGNVTLTASISTADDNVATNLSRSVALRVRDPDATVTISGWTAVDRLYDQTTNVSVTGTAELTGFLPGQDVVLTGTPSFSIATPNAGTNIPVIITGLSLTGEDALFYSLELPELTVNISPVSLTVTGAVAQNKLFDDTTLAIIAGGGLSGVLEGDDVSLANAATGTFAQSAVGTNITVTTAMILSGAQAGNYTLAQPLLSASILASDYFFLRDNAPSGPEFSRITDANLFYLGKQAVPLLGVGVEQSIGATVFPGIANSVFTNGTEASLGLTLQTTNAANLIVYGPDDDGGFGRIGPSTLASTFDILMAPPGFAGGIRAVSMAGRASSQSTIVIQLFNADGLAATYTFAPGVERIGFIAAVTGINRIRLTAPGGFLEVGEIALYVNAGPASAASSSIAINPASGAYADAGSLVTVTVRDEGGRIRSGGGDLVFMTSQSGVLSLINDNRDGTYTATLSRTNAGAATAIAYLGASTNAPVIGSVTGSFIYARAAALSPLTVDSSVIDISSGITTARTAVADAFGGIPPDIRVRFSSSNTNIVTVTAESFSANNGLVSAVVSAGSQTGEAFITASLDAADDNVASNVARSVRVRVRDPSNIVTITGWTTVNRDYDQTTEVIVLGTGELSGVPPGADVTLIGDPIFTLASPNAGTNIPVIIDGLELGGDDAELFVFELPALTMDIAPLPLTVTGAVAQSKLFDGTKLALISGAGLSGVLTGDTVTLQNAATGTFAQATAGTNIAVTTFMTLGGAQAVNYTLAQPVLSADIIASDYFFVSDGDASGGDFSAITNANLYFLGKQSMPLLAPGNEVLIGSNVFPGVANGVFSNGTSTALGLTLQSGVNLLVYGPDAPGGFGRIGPSVKGQGMDILVNPPGYAGMILGVSMAARASDDRPMTMQLFNSSGLVATYVFASGVERIGFVTQVPGVNRIRLVAAGGFIELGEITLYSMAGPASAAQSTISASPTNGIPVDAFSLVNVTIADSAGRVRAGGGDLVFFSVHGGTISSVADLRNGNYQVELRRSSIGDATVSAYLGASTNDSFIGSVTVGFIAGRATTLTNVTIDASVINFNGATTTARARVLDAFGNSVEGVRVLFTSSNTNIATMAAESLTGNDGRATATVTSGPQTGPVTITVSLDGNDANVASNVTRSLSLTVRDPSAFVSITGWTPVDRVYDRTTNVLVEGVAEITGAAPGADLLLLGSPQFHVATPFAGSNRVITITGITLGGSDAALYTLDLPLLTVNISPVVLTVTNAVALDKAEDGTTAANIVGATLAGVLPGDTVTLLNASTGTFAQAEIGTNIAMTTAMTLGGPQAGGYTLVQPALVANIVERNYFFFSSELEQGGEFTNIVNAGLYFIGKQSMPVLAPFNEVETTNVIFPGVAAPLFPSGTSNALGITLQSNNGGINPASASPGANLVVVGPDAPGGYGRIGPSTRLNSLDIIMAPPGYAGLVTAVSLAARAENQSTLIMRLYGLNGLLASHVFPAGVERAGFIANLPGVVRINLFAPDGFFQAGEISLYSGAGPADAGQSTITASPVTNAYTDLGSVITVTVRDAGGRIRSGGGDLVFLSAQGGTVSTLSDNRDGHYTAMLTRTNTGAASVSAYLGSSTNAPLIGSASVIFTRTRAAIIEELTLDDAVININGGSTTLRTRVTTAGGIAAPDVRVVFTSSNTNIATIAPEAVTDTNGIVGAAVTGGSSLGTVTLSANILAVDENVASNVTRQITLRTRDPASTVTITGWTAEDRVYNRTTNIVVQGTGELAGVPPGADVVLLGEARFFLASPNAGSNRIINITGVSLGGVDAPLYTLELPVLTANISPVSLTVTGAVALSRVFDQTTRAVIAGAGLSGVITGDQVVLLNATTGVFAQASTGTNIAVTTAMMLGGAQASNYALTQPALQADIFASPYFFVHDASATGPEFARIVASNLNLIGRQSIPDLPVFDERVIGNSVQPGINAGSVFPSGTDVAIGLTLQSNASGTNPVVTTAGGSLIARGPEVVGLFSRIGLANAANSFDIIMNPAGYAGLVQAVSMAARAANDAPIVMRLYNAGGLAATYHFPSGVQRIGFTADISGVNRVNLFAPDGLLDVGEISLYSLVGPTSADASTITASLTNNLRANRLEFSTLTVTLRDANGRVRVNGGENVFLALNDGYLSSLNDLRNGEYTTQLRSTLGGTVTVSAYLGTSSADPFIGSVDVSFFTALVTNNTPVPVNEVWLVDYGFTNNFDAVVGLDLDGDGYAVWEEYIMDTNPTNANDYLRFSGIRPVEGTNFVERVYADPENPFILYTQRIYEVIGEAVSWSASTQRVYSISSSASLTTLAWSNGPAIRPVVSSVTITNIFDAGRIHFRRLKVSLPDDGF